MADFAETVELATLDKEMAEEKVNVVFVTGIVFVITVQMQASGLEFRGVRT